jgi:hypothetical protein
MGRILMVLAVPTVLSSPILASGRGHGALHDLERLRPGSPSLHRPRKALSRSGPPAPG